MEKNLDVKQRLYGLLSSRPNAFQFISNLELETEMYLFGGCLRDYDANRFSRLPRDIDIVVNTKKSIEDFINKDVCSIRRNKFGGFKIKIDDISLDVWNISNTWAIKEKKFELNVVQDLTKTVFLNIDGLLYDMRNGLLYTDLFKQAVSDNRLDIVLNDNPQPELNIARAFRFKQDYNFSFSSKLHDYCKNWVKAVGDNTIVVSRLSKIEMKRYNSATVNWDSEIKELMN